MSTPADTRSTTDPAERWTAVFHRANGWMDAPAGAYFQSRGDMVELVGAVHRCGSVWYASSITQRRNE